METVEDTIFGMDKKKFYIMSGVILIIFAIIAIAAIISLSPDKTGDNIMKPHNVTPVQTSPVISVITTSSINDIKTITTVNR